MTKEGPVIVIEDDVDDQFILQQIFRELNYPNEVVYFSNGEDALVHLLERPEVNPFLILSDINLPKLNGFALREKIHNNEALRLKCIPYLFFTTASDQKMVIEAYSRSIQGFFIKPSTISLLHKTIQTMMEYWTLCTAPNREERI